MQLGVLDLGERGTAIARRLLAGGHRCVVFDASPRRVAELAAEMAHGAASIADLVNELDAPRVICLAGPVEGIEATIAELRPHAAAGDVIIDFADSYYVDDIRRARELGPAGIHYVDVGMSGSACPGYCLTIGGDAVVVRCLDPIFKQLTAAPDREAALDAQGCTAQHGYLHCGSVGAGHFVNMIHNGIEYCLMAAYAEGFSILHAANVGRKDSTNNGEPCRVRFPEYYQYQFNLTDVAEVWRHGSMVASSILDLTARALTRNTSAAALSGLARHVREDWPALRAAVDEAIPIPVLASAMYLSLGVRDESDFSNKLLTAVQHECRDPVESRAMTGRSAAGNA